MGRRFSLAFLDPEFGLVKSHSGNESSSNGDSPPRESRIEALVDYANGDGSKRGQLEYCRHMV